MFVVAENVVLATRSMQLTAPTRQQVRLAATGSQADSVEVTLLGVLLTQPLQSLRTMSPSTAAAFPHYKHAYTMLQAYRLIEC